MTAPLLRAPSVIRPRFGADQPPLIQLSTVTPTAPEKPGFVERLKNSAKISWIKFKELTFIGVAKDVAITTAASTALTFFLGPMHLIFIPTFVAVAVGWNLGWPIVSGVWNGLRGVTPEQYKDDLANQPSPPTKP